MTDDQIIDRALYKYYNWICDLSCAMCQKGFRTEGGMVPTARDIREAMGHREEVRVLLMKRRNQNDNEGTKDRG
jgi:hypothetical protein